MPIQPSGSIEAHHIYNNEGQITEKKFITTINGENKTVELIESSALLYQKAHISLVIKRFLVVVSIGIIVAALFCGPIKVLTAATLSAKVIYGCVTGSAAILAIPLIILNANKIKKLKNTCNILKIYYDANQCIQAENHPTAIAMQSNFNKATVQSLRKTNTEETTKYTYNQNKFVIARTTP